MTDTSTKPYFIRAIYEWCGDNAFTPYLAVSVDDKTTVPTEYIKDGQIVLNISPTAAHGLLIKNTWIEFQARFNGIARSILIPVERVTAIYARENGHGMAFEVTPYSPISAKPSEGLVVDSPQDVSVAKKNKIPPFNAIGPRLVTSDLEKATKQQALQIDDQPSNGDDLANSQQKPVIKPTSGKKDSKKSTPKKKSHLTRIK